MARATVEMAYGSLLGYYNTNLKKIGWSKQTLVTNMNKWVWVRPPPPPPGWEFFPYNPVFLSDNDPNYTNYLIGLEGGWPKPRRGEPEVGPIEASRSILNVESCDCEKF